MISGSPPTWICQVAADIGRVAGHDPDGVKRNAQVPRVLVPKESEMMVIHR